SRGKPRPGVFWSIKPTAPSTLASPRAVAGLIQLPQDRARKTHAMATRTAQAPSPAYLTLVMLPSLTPPKPAAREIGISTKKIVTKAPQSLTATEMTLTRDQAKAASIFSTA